MAKGKRRQTRRTPPNQARATPTRQQPSPEKAARELVAEANALAEQEGLPAPDPSAIDDAGTDVSEAVKSALAAKQAFDDARQKFDDATLALEKEQETVSAEADRHAADRAALEREQQTLADDKAAYSERDAVLLEKELALAKREADADAGFLARREEILGPIRERLVELTDSWHKQERKLLADWDQKLIARRQELDAEVAVVRENLAKERGAAADLRAANEAEQARLLREEQRLDGRRAVLDEDDAAVQADRADLERRVTVEVESRLRDHGAKTRRLEERVRLLEPYEATIEELRGTIGDDPARILERVTTLEQEGRQLREELAIRPPAAVQDDLDAALQRLRAAEAERDDALRQRRELDQQISYQAATLAARDQLELTNEALAASTEAYKAELTELREQLRQLTSEAGATTAFPECRAMDLEPRYRSSGTGREPGDLADFVAELQLRMAHDPEARKEGRQLNYRLGDLRIFLAGMAMSHLHLLEGVSGTGKTTLPRAFARAMRAGEKTIEVQAGWRDRQDLLGYYNSFERVYRESECLQWLYRARLPAYEDRPIFLILDEMNLSHPEQYFADFLSVLENPSSPISLVDRQLPDVPEFMETAAGVQLPLARNVWFVGTANQDETTFGFAPKTYDRAHVMALEPNAPVVEGAEPPAAPPVSLASLQAAFGDAQRRHAKDAATARSFIADLEPFFNDRFRVGWGHRMNDHVDRFLPVDIAAGGSLGEALDHLVTSKLIKKITGRHSLRRDALEELGEIIDATWPDGMHKPEQISRAIESEIRDLSLG